MNNGLKQISLAGLGAVGVVVYLIAIKYIMALIYIDSNAAWVLTGLLFFVLFFLKLFYQTKKKKIKLKKKK